MLSAFFTHLEALPLSDDDSTLTMPMRAAMSTKRLKISNIAQVAVSPMDDAVAQPPSMSEPSTSSPWAMSSTLASSTFFFILFFVI